MKRSATSATNVTPSGGAAAEQVIVTIPAPSMAENPLISGVVVDAVVLWTAGTGTTATIFRVRRNTLTGSVVGPQFSGGAAGAQSNTPIAALDTTLSPPPSAYVITAQQTGGTANGTLNYATASATAA